MRLLSFFLPGLAVLAVAFAVFRIASGYFESEELVKAQGRLSLYQSSVSAELERYSHLTYVLARDPYVQAAASGGGRLPVNQRLEEFAAQAGLDAIYLIDPDGLTIAASNYRDENSFLGQNYGFRPYFQQALAGQQGRFYAIGATTGLPGYFIADAVLDDNGQVTGVIAIKIDLSKLEQSWKRSGEQVLLSNADGVVLLASDPSWRYRVMAALSSEQRAEIDAARQFAGQALHVLDWQRGEGANVRIAGEDRLHLTAQDLPHGWQLHYFASDDRVVTRSWLVTAVVGVLAALLFIALQIQRARRVGRALRRAEQEEAMLRQSNERLAVEIEERRTAERRLQRTKDELERASRLAALGRLAASVTHELGQPITAMRNHLVAAEIANPSQSGLAGKIGELVDRMDGITKQLKFFARSEPESFAELDLTAAVKVALSLVQPNLGPHLTEVQLNVPDTPVMAWGIRLRVEQVMTNLLRNAVDATEGGLNPRIRISVAQEAALSWVEIEDNGHGLGAATLADLQEPFVTSRESGRGMGLGLAISADIVRDHNGEMTARNSDTGGAIFRVSFPRTAQMEDSP